MRTYLDDLPLQADPTSPEARLEVKSKGKEWFQHSDSFTSNLEKAFKLWDAVSAKESNQFSPHELIFFFNQVYKGTQNANKEFKDVQLWKEANEWLSARR